MARLSPPAAARSRPRGALPVAGVDAGRSHDPAVPAQPELAWLQRPGLPGLSLMPPLALYVHVPWCLRKCPYCDFNSHEHRGGGPELPEAAYLDALCADLEAALPLVWGRRVVSVFVGGGTPSLLSAAAVERLLVELRARLPLAPDAEITLEANPGSFEAAKFQAYRAAGVNRLSIGVQSLDPSALVALGRVHDRDQALAAVETARRCFDTWNVDLMYALPGQDAEGAGRDLEQALALAPPHLSLYQLTIEPDTAFAQRPPAALPDHDAAADIHDRVEARAVAAGYRHYEVSAYAQRGHECRHNLNYWQFGDYLGIGAGAASKLSFPHRIVRMSRWRKPATYIERALAGAAVSEFEEVPRARLPFEFMLNALRLTEGFATSLMSERTGLPPTAFEAGLAQAEARGLLERDHARIVPSLRGRRFLTDLQALFLPPGQE